MRKKEQWANGVLKNYIQNGYVLNSAKLTEQKITLLENDLKLLQTKVKDKQLQTDEKFNKLLRSIEAKSLKPTQGIFYDGEIYDAYLFVSNLIKSAKESIVLIDNYLDESVLTMLTKCKCHPLHKKHHRTIRTRHQKTQRPIPKNYSQKVRRLP